MHKQAISSYHYWYDYKFYVHIRKADKHVLTQHKTTVSCIHVVLHCTLVCLNNGQRYGYLSQFTVGKTLLFDCTSAGVNSQKKMTRPLLYCHKQLTSFTLNS